MRGVLIDPVARSVAAVEFDGTSAHLRALLGDRPPAAYRVDDETVAYVDDESLLIDQAGQAYFNFTTGRYRQIIAGRVLLLGVDRRGRDQACEKSVASVSASVLWRDDIEFCGMEETIDEGTNASGGRTIRIRREARWRPKGTETYICAVCGEVFASTPEQEAAARARYRDRFGRDPEPDAVDVCDDCAPGIEAALAARAAQARGA